MSHRPTPAEQADAFKEVNRRRGREEALGSARADGIATHDEHRALEIHQAWQAQCTRRHHGVEEHATDRKSGRKRRRSPPKRRAPTPVLDDIVSFLNRELRRVLGLG